VKVFHVNLIIYIINFNPKTS